MAATRSNKWHPKLEKRDIPADGDFASFLKHLPASAIIDAEPVPFEHAFAPWLHCLHKQLESHCPQYTEICTKKARGHMIRSVLVKLQKYIGLALQLDFNHQRPDRFFSLFLPPANSHGNTGGDTQYRQYVKKIIRDGWKDFFRRFPVAGTLMDTVLSDSYTYFRSFLEHFASDRYRLYAVSGISPSVLPVIDGLESGLSDPHQGGRTVLKLTFETTDTDIDGPKGCFYKPRSFSIDRAWENALAWLGGKTGLTFLTPRGIDGQDYCWVEPLANQSLDSPETGALYYRRAGAILAGLYVLGGTDFHQENVIACGSHPVLIDVETLLCPLVRPFVYDALDDRQTRAVLSLDADNVMRTFLLPMWISTGNNVFHDYGGFTPADKRRFAMYKWVHVNTDQMQRIKAPGSTQSLANIPHYRGRRIPLTDHMDAFMEGFRTAYRVFMIHGHEVEKDDGGWTALKHCTFRVLPRTTQIYENMSRRLASASLLKNHDRFQREVEKLSRAFRHPDIPPHRQRELEAVARLERDALMRHDIPVLHARATDLAARRGDRIILDDFFLVDGWHEFLRRLNKLDENDLAFQTGLISASFSMRYPAEIADNIAPDRTLSWKNAPPCSKERFMEEAALIAHDIAGRAMERNGRTLWLSRKFDPMTHLLTIGPTDDGLYEGTVGIGLFLACWENITGNRRYHDLAQSCFQPVFELTDRMAREDGRIAVGLGIGSGVSGIAWSLLLGSRLLNTPSLYELALNLIEGTIKGLTSCLQQDQTCDVMGGSAGMILTLVNCFMRHGPGDAPKDREYRDRFGRAGLLNLARLCGDNLLKKRVCFKNRMLWPSNYAHQPLTGFAHGAAGYACAMLRLYGVTRDKRCMDAAIEAIDYERSVYVSKANNWPDFRVNHDVPKGQTVFMSGWCAGAPGIGMARLMTLDILDTPGVRQDIENALAFTSDRLFDPGAADHFCCGTSGRVAFLLEAGIGLHRQNMIESAFAGASYMVHRAKEIGRYTFSGDINGPVFSPGLYTGLAGVGMTFMRLAHPDKVPSLMAPGII